ncbi:MULTISPECIES: hypothetical protein [unclassified Clostridium]|uniref:hypothetical protein n=1 Tax=unclassified Clostridium TaxID=2614128 RepID=UPI00207A2E60|nr:MULTISPECIES: hypothetical protein [unclassified Clostridium]
MREILKNKLEIIQSKAQKIKNELLEIKKNNKLKENGFKDKRQLDDMINRLDKILNKQSDNKFDNSKYYIDKEKLFNSKTLDELMQNIPLIHLSDFINELSKDEKEKCLKQLDKLLNNDK